jgi:hypothetical protein
MATPAPGLATRLARAVTEIDHALRHTAPADTSSLEHLREAGWQLVHLAGNLTDLTALLADHLGHHAANPDRFRDSDGGPAAPQLARASRDLAALRQALDTAQTEARGYHTALSHLTADPPQPDRPS